MIAAKDYYCRISQDFMCLVMLIICCLLSLDGHVNWIHAFVKYRQLICLQVLCLNCLTKLSMLCSSLPTFYYFLVVHPNYLILVLQFWCLLQFLVAIICTSVLIFLKPHDTSCILDKGKYSSTRIFYAWNNIAFLCLVQCFISIYATECLTYIGSCYLGLAFWTTSFCNWC